MNRPPLFPEEPLRQLLRDTGPAQTDAVFQTAVRNRIAAERRQHRTVMFLGLLICIGILGTAVALLLPLAGSACDLLWRTVVVPGLRALPVLQQLLTVCLNQLGALIPLLWSGARLGINALLCITALLAGFTQLFTYLLVKRVHSL